MVEVFVSSQEEITPSNAWVNRFPAYKVIKYMSW